MLKIRINGRGNAWPIQLGQEHPFYDKNNPGDLANASYSILKKKGDVIEKEILIDAGHGTVPFLIKNQNRIPDAIILTHPHIDHTLSIDWIAQSFYRQTETKYTVYASKMCWKRVLQSFPQLEKIVEFYELLPACEQRIKEFPGLTVTFHPVFHGESAPGAGMLYFKYPTGQTFSKALFTGDLLCPLLRKRDYIELSGCDFVFVDSNNRFPYPKTNHWSITGSTHFSKPELEFFKDWYIEKGNNLNWLCRPNTPINFTPEIHNYFDEFVKEQLPENTIPYTVFDFAKLIEPKQINLVHYSGKQDEQYYDQQILSEQELKKWADESARKAGLSSKLIVPKVGDEFDWLIWQI